MGLREVDELSSLLGLPEGSERVGRAFRSIFKFEENKTGTFARPVLYVDNRGIDGRDGRASV
jgi:hypothetical protein